ncbi:MAG: hypothetical protein HQL31_02150 [Planctomycetes bacterium]|nr:hypothetical protein [Planctomycetota bacterium]
MQEMNERGLNKGFFCGKFSNPFAKIVPIAALYICTGLGLYAATPPVENMPTPEITVVKTPVPPVIDGKMEEGEWDFATAGTGYMAKRFSVEKQILAQNQNIFWITYDDKKIYICLKNYRAEAQAVLRKGARDPDMVDIVFDDSNEIWLTPPAAMPTTYQTMFNSYPAVYDVVLIPSIGHIGKGWEGKWKMASSETAEYWIIEASIPIASLGVEGIRDGDTWKALFTADLLGSSGFRRWGPWVTHAFKDMAGHDIVHFKDSAPVVQMLDVESVTTGKAEFPITITAPARGKCKVTVKVRFGAEINLSPEDVEVSKTIEVADGKKEAFMISADISSLKLPIMTLDVKPQRDEPVGYCETTATDKDGTVIYHYVFRFPLGGHKRVSPAKLVENAYDTPFGVKAFYAPFSKKLVVEVDRYYMRNRSEVAGGFSRLIDKEDGKVVAKGPLPVFRKDYSKMTLDVSALSLPVETEEVWKGEEKIREINELITETNKELKEKGQTEIPLKPSSGPIAKEFTAETVLNDKDGKEIARVSTPVNLMNYQYEWLGHDLGISDKVIPPWTPLKWKDENISLWNKTYTINSLGLANKIINSGAEMLAKPMQLQVTIDGKEKNLGTEAPVIKKIREAYIEMVGQSMCGDLEINIETRVEFDGFVKNRMTLNPRKPVKLDKMSLVVELPSEIAQFMAASPGGHAAYGLVSDSWSSRAIAPGSRVGSFVPYVFLTNSEQGFCWCADNDKGWVIDPNGDALTLNKVGNIVTFKANFIQLPVTLEKPVTIEYAWMVTPQKPRLADWRAVAFTYEKLYPQMRPVFLSNFDRRKVWDYYSSPYPKDMDKSREEIRKKSKEKTGITFFVGNTGDSLGHWEDYKGRKFGVLANDWATVPGEKSIGIVTRAKGPNDYELWNWDRWIRLGGLEAVYYDINSLDQEWNYLSGTAYYLPDGSLQPGYSYLGQREYMKRLRYILESHGKKRPYLFHHSTNSQPVFSWLTDILWEAENVHPSDFDADYIKVFPAVRMRTLAMGENIGASPLFVCSGHRDVKPFHKAQFIGWAAIHDTIEGSRLWSYLAAENELWQEDTRFLPYWKKGLGIESKTNDVCVSAHVRNSHALLWIMNTARKDQEAEVQVDMKDLGLDPAKTRVFDAETGEAYPMKDGRLKVKVPSRMWKAVRLQELNKLKENQAFIADFDSGEVAADESVGYRYAIAKEVLLASVRGKSGLGVDLEEARTFWARHNLDAKTGHIQFDAQFGRLSQGTLFSMVAENPVGDGMEDLNLVIRKGKLFLETTLTEKTADPKAKPKKSTQQLAETVWSIPAGRDWHGVSITWEDRNFKVTIDGRELLTATLPSVVPASSYMRAQQAFEGGNGSQAIVSFGPLAGTAIDNLGMGK